MCGRVLTSVYERQWLQGKNITTDHEKHSDHGVSSIKERYEGKLNDSGLLLTLPVAIFDELLVGEQYVEKEDEKRRYSSQSIKGRCSVDAPGLVFGAIASA